MNCFFRGRMTITEGTVNLSILARLFSLLGGLAIANPPNSVLAQITPDNTLGVERSVITPNANIKGAAADQINGGAIRSRLYPFLPTGHHKCRRSLKNAAFAAYITFKYSLAEYWLLMQYTEAAR
jgi:hypothetical protein